MRSVGSRCRRLVSLLICTAASVATLCAQSIDDEPYISSYFSEYHPPVQADTLIFYRTIHNTEDLFSDVADYDLSFVASSRRGERSYRYETVFNGIPVRSEYRSTLDRLKLRRQSYPGLRHSKTYAGNAVGFTEYSTVFAEPLRKYTAGVNMTNRGYRFGFNGTMSRTLRHGWSMSGYVSGRTGRDMLVKGVFTNGLDAGIRLFKHWNYDNRLTLAAMFSPSERGMRRASTAEAFTLTGDNLYNPSWGYQNGKIRNANVRRTFVPTLLAAYDNDLTSRTTLTISAGADLGIVKYSSLEWFDALTPMPDNYRFMPSYYDNDYVADGVADAWRKNDTRYTQIYWDELCQQNAMTGGHAVYAVGDRVERITTLNMRASVRTSLKRHLMLTCGAQLSYDRRRNYRQMRDLLGSDYIVDIDRYIMDDATYGSMRQNDLRNPDRKIVEGDRYAYDYALVESYAGAFAMLDYQSARSHFTAAAEIGDKTVFRRGYYEKELFAGSDSYGRSRKIRISPYTVKASYGFSFTPRHYLEACASFAGESPDARDLFLQTQYNNRTIDNPRLRTVAGGEINYTFLHRIFKLRASLFAMATFGDCEVSHYFDDLATEYCDMVVSDIDRLRLGVELSAKVRISRRFNISTAFSAGRYTYYSDPRISLYADTDNRLICDRAVAHMGACKVGNAPQIAGTVEATYLYRGWGVRLAANYAGLRYVEPAAMRRTQRVSRQGSVSEEMFLNFVTQERLPDAATVDGTIWKTFWLKRGYRTRHRLVVSLSARNILNSKNIIYNARESSRIMRLRIADGYYYSPFPTTYLYAMPRTLRLSVSYRF